MKRIFNIVLLIFFFIFIIPQVSFARDYIADYNVEYFLNEQNAEINSRVKFGIKLTNLKTEVYVRRFGLSFPKSFTISNLEAEADGVHINPKVTTEGTQTIVQLDLPNPKRGKDSVNNLTLSFDQTNLFQISGTIWEVILPTLKGESKGEYKVTVHLPSSTPRKIAIAKPRPSGIKGHDIWWDNPANSTIYAVFGDTQNYKMNLTYNLQNEKVKRQDQEIALPPDTLYQKVFIESLSPKPLKVRTDEDGNYLATYAINPKQKLTVSYAGVAQLTTSTRPEVHALQSTIIKQQEQYLLTNRPLWSIQSPEKYSTLKSPNDIYKFVVSSLSYNYDKLRTNVGRVGAQKALSNPTSAVCTEFSDTFVALAREKGILSREVEGYGYSKDHALRPLSLVSDILHSWPEYYDKDSQRWIAIDPTWESTSGIDYFTSLDLNHIVFAIHGQDTTNPRPAGSYKIGNSKDISVQPTSTVPQEISKLAVSDLKIPTQINDKESHDSQFTIENQGNTSVWGIPLNFQSEDIDTHISESQITQLAPYEKKNVKFTIQAKHKGQKKKAELTLIVGNEQKIMRQVLILPYSQDLGIKVVYVFLGICIVIIFIRISTIRKKK